VETTSIITTSIHTNNKLDNICHYIIIIIIIISRSRRRRRR
jgi:hypothetical protein